MTDLVGRTLGKYRVVAHLGRGGMAEVYKAYQAGLDRYVAVKVLQNRDTDQSDFVKRFEREAAAVARLRHPNIVQVYDFDSEDDLYYMVMEFIDGPTLKAELQQRQANGRIFTLRETSRLFSGLTTAVDYAHSHGMIHRDLKPANIMLNAEGQVVLTDFGIALIVGAMRYTLTGALGGTPAYMSPEQGQGQPGDERSDIYSLGVILFELVTGRIPFDADTPVAIMIKHMNDPLPLARTINPNIPEAVERVILKALSKKPEDRYQSAGEMAKALREAASATVDSTRPAGIPLAALTASTASQSKTASAAPSPYRGLLAFREEEAPFFFGREAFTERLVEAIHTSHQLLVAVIGPSGSGKSSVVSAGLLPRLREATLQPTPVSAVWKDQGHAWMITGFRPGAHPFQALALALFPQLEPQLDKPTLLAESRKLSEALRRGEIGLHDVVERLLRKNPQAGRLLLFADQFEELYTLCPEPKLRRQFLDLLLEAVNAQSHRREPALTLIFALRADFLEHLLAHRPVADAVQNAAFILGPMNREEMKQAIEKPAAKQGLSLEPGLTEHLLDDAGDRPDRLPLLEFALTYLYERQAGQPLTHAAYNSLGRVEGALEQYAEEVYDGLNEVERERARQIFMQMVQLGEETSTGDTRRIATRTELGEAGWALAQALAQAKLVVTSENSDGQATAEIVHETLIQNWGRLRGWISADRAFQRWRDRLQPTLRRWEANPVDVIPLLSGAALVEAEHWFARRSWDLTEAEQKFIQASLARREREEAELEAERQREIQAAQKSVQAERQRAEEQTRAVRRLRRSALFLIGAVVVTGVLAVGAAVFGLEANQHQQLAGATLTQSAAESSQAQKQLQLATSRELATVAADNLKTDPELSLLLAIQAASAADTVEAENALYQTMPALKPLALSGFSGRVKGLAYSPDKTRLATASTDKTAKVWDISTVLNAGPASGEALLTLAEHTDQVLAVAFSPDGKLMATASADKTAKVWDSTSGQALLTLASHTDQVLALAFSPDGKRLATASADQTAKIWDATSGQVLLNLTGHTDQVLAVAFSPDGKHLATASADKTAKVWDSTSGEALLTLAEHTDQVLALAFSPDGKRLATTSADQTVKLWEASSGKILLTLSKTGTVLGLAFNPDGTRLMTINQDWAIQAWDTSSGERLFTLPAPAAAVAGVAFSPDGTQLAVAGSDGTVYFYPLKIEDMIAWAKTQVTRSLTTEECRKYLHVEACP